jgi:hypothetical protein
MNEYILIERFYRLARLWWLIVLAALLGSLVGYLLHTSRPPIYEATAIFEANIDFSRLEGVALTQYDEDLALSTMSQALYYSPELYDRLIPHPTFQASGMDYYTWIPSVTIERQHAFWKLRFRHPDPQIAQSLVNLWAELGDGLIREWQAAGKFPDYVVVSTPRLADLPLEPAIYGRNQMMFASTLLGMLVGIALVEFSSPINRRSKREIEMQEES